MRCDVGLFAIDFAVLSIYFVECYAASVMPDQTGNASVLSVMTHWFRPRLAQCVVGWAPVLSIASVLFCPGSN